MEPFAVAKIEIILFVCIFLSIFLSLILKKLAILPIFKAIALTFLLQEFGAKYQ